MTLVNLSEGNDNNSEHLRTEECALCGAEYGEDYKQFASHLRSDHGPEDVGLAWSTEPRTARGGA